MAEQNKNFHPVTRYCAAFGAVICLIFSIGTFINAVALLPGISGVGIELFRSVAMLYLGWCFWYAFKRGENPFKAKLFSK